MNREERVTEITQAVTDALAGIIREHQISEEEWYAALQFLTEVGKADEFILLSDVMRLSVLVDELSHPDEDGVTASDLAGPFWRQAPLLESPATLVPDDEPGERLTLSGVVRRAGGSPVAGAELDFWQCNADGVYDVQLGSEEPRYRGRLHSGVDGRYELQTIVPPPYQVKNDGPVGRLLERLGRHPWRPAHVHVKAEAPGCRPLTTMLFVSDDPWLGQDVIGGDKPSLVVKLERSEGRAATAVFDIVLAEG